ncbi:probable polyamine transporter At3g13620 [Cucurbita pepo subsp. pepo]|uniref:probable polyamine transporter At3g13620 n=1 Tax=Cucurbita pepo subsp. pepo TaxID=3664 RepID=UPI000C9D58A3|nr:probable polyamine transporter At3g13620 [Cucurbita pepo subsp. pepo]XP_023516718.1 probable polyamine transporter At3g13620 [Cucurbita pepo subsp. pepo]XP_023516719.1 probable polyamine transporter At3g13620 [Cucurbita pepo subsp. pepo]
MDHQIGVPNPHPHQKPTSNSDLPPPILPTTTPNSPIPAAKKLTLIPLIFLIYFEVAGGPYGEEPAVQAAGPLLAIIGFIVFPFIWSVPEALITAELSTAFPGNGGFVIWAQRAFGPFWGSLMGTWKILSGVINIAAYPVLCINYIQKIAPQLQSGWPRRTALLASSVVLAALNYIGLTIVGYVAVVLALLSILPFILMTLIAIPKIKPHRWGNPGDKSIKTDWNLYLNTLFWNLNFWDNVSTLAGEVEKPKKTFPIALFISVIITCLSYLIPLLAVTGAVDIQQSAWESGFHAQAAETLAGKWLKILLEIGACLSAIGLFEAQLSSSAYQILGMAEIGILPKFFAARAKWFNTPWIGIVICTAISVGVSYLDFTDIVASANFMYSLGMLLEFSSFIWLRWKHSAMERPFKVPLELPGLIVMCLVPSAFLVVLMVFTHTTVFLVSASMTAAGIVWFGLMKICRKKKIFIFNPRPED